MSTQKFWKELVIPKRIEKPGQYIMWTAGKCFPCLSQVVWRKPNSTPIKTKDKAARAIGKYLTSVKRIAMLITEYTYGVRGSDKAVSKCDRLFEPTDVLDMCGYIKVMDDALDGAKICNLTAKMVPSSFHHIDIHYTYMLTNMLSLAGEEIDGENVEIDVGVDSDDEDDDLEEGTVEYDENEPRFDLILRYYTHTLTNTLSLAGEEFYGEKVEINVGVDSDDEDDDLEEGTVEYNDNEPQFNSIS